MCENENSGSTLKVYNLGAMAVTSYSVVVRLKTTLTSGSPARPTVTIQTYYNIDVDTSVVHQIDELLSSNPTNNYHLPN